MQSHELQDFKDVMRDAREAIGQGEAYTDGALELMFAALRDLELREIQAALVAHINGPDGRWRPNAHYIREAISRRAAVAWVSADEAWATVPKMESETGLLNQVTAAALAIVQSQIDDGDMIGARVAFLKAYKARVEKAKTDPDLSQRVPITWVSGGNHPERFQDAHGERILALERGQAAGLLPAPNKQQQAPQLSHSKMPSEVRAALLAYKPKIINNRISEES